MHHLPITPAEQIAKEILKLVHEARDLGYEITVETHEPDASTGWAGGPIVTTAPLEDNTASGNLGVVR
jgi:hypothetical protein